MLVEIEDFFQSLRDAHPHFVTSLFEHIDTVHLFLKMRPIWPRIMVCLCHE